MDNEGEASITWARQLCNKGQFQEIDMGCASATADGKAADGRGL